MEDEELSFGDVTPEHQHLKGYQKVKAFCEEARRNNFHYAWADTCCIDKKSSAELGEAINSMYMWYERADICYAYLCDVDGVDDVAQSSWLTRGWTLQELLAPTKLHFYNSGWSPIASRHELSAELEALSGIPQLALHNFRHGDFCVAEKMAWAARRQTTREEDSACCLLGLFNVNMPLLDGEGSKAFLRFQEEIMKVSTDLSILLWQGNASLMNGMLAAAPSSFKKDYRNPLDLLMHKDLFNIPRGWTTNNAGTDTQLHVYPYLLTRDTKKIFLACVHKVDNLWRPGYGIFLQELNEFESRATPSYRRVRVKGDAWIKIELPHQNAQRLDWASGIDAFWLAISTLFYESIPSEGCETSEMLPSSCRTTRPENDPYDHVMPAFSNGRRKDIHPRRSNTSNSSLLNASFHQARRFPSWQDPSKIPPPDPRRRAAVMGALDGSTNALDTPRQIKQFMQDDDYVLWDFSSTAVSPHGMLQVHGGPGV
ncbi:hypothetical protein MBLNU13_g04265t1 [Cladosporium sp. NU13]